MAHPGGYPPYGGVSQGAAYPSAQPGQPGYPPGYTAQPGQPGYTPGQPAPGYPGQAPPAGGYPHTGPVAGGYPSGQPGYAAGSAGGPPPGMDPSVYQWFMTVDTDKSGKINMFELQQALTNANWTHFNAETCRLMIGLFDRDQSGQIDMNEFGALWGYILQWRGVFEQFDKDKSGSIDINELSNAYTQMGYRLSPQFAQLIVYRYDPLNKQRLTLDNFIQSCVLLKTVTDTFKQKDTQMQGRIQIEYEEFVRMVLLNKPA